jgi:hypothetical protein
VHREELIEKHDSYQSPFPEQKMELGQNYASFHVSETRVDCNVARRVCAQSQISREQVARADKTSRASGTPPSCGIATSECVSLEKFPNRLAQCVVPHGVL